MGQKRVLLTRGDFMKDYEAMVPFQALQVYGVTVDVVCPGKKVGDFYLTATQQMTEHQTYSETRGHNFVLNATFDEIYNNSYDGLVLHSGRAPKYLAHNPRVVELVAYFATSRKPISCICHSQLIVATAGAFKVRKCIAYAPVGPPLVAGGGIWVKPKSLATTVIDGNLISGATYQDHREVIHYFVKALGGTISGSNKRILFWSGLTLSPSSQLRIEFLVESEFM